MEFTGERAVPWSSGQRDWSWVMQHHVQRYTWALQYVSSERVLDLGCGTGYGAFMLSWLANHVTALDVSGEAIRFAEQHFGSAPNLTFRSVEIVSEFWPTWSDRQYDVITAFEILEHLTVSEMRIVLDRMKGVCTQDGILIGSIPVEDPGRFHKQVLTQSDILRLFPSPRTQFFFQLEDGQIRPLHTWDGRCKYVLFMTPVGEL